MRIGIIRKHENEKNLIRQQISELESKALANQMNPHFIFNSLNTVQQFILAREEKTALNYLTDFADLMREILSNSRKPFISLSEEIEFIKNYLNLEIIRYNHSFDYELVIPSGLLSEDINVPPMLFQPIIENAVKYSFSSNSIQPSTIKINIEKKDGFIIFIVEDFGSGIESLKKASPLPVKKQSAALKVVSARLSHLKTQNGEAGSIHLKE